MKFHPNTARSLFRPSWLALIIVSALIAAIAAFSVGVQQDAGETSTTFLFGRRIGYLNRPIPVLDDHLAEIVNSVEFPIVFERIEERLLLRADRDYELSIGIVDDTESLVEIVVRTNNSGEADRIARIVAEEMVSFVIDSQELSITTEIDDLQRQIDNIEDEQSRLIALSGDIPPTTVLTRLQQQLTGLRGDSSAPVGPHVAELQEEIRLISPLESDYRRNTITLARLRRTQSDSIVERSDLTASSVSINQEWYRSITPVESTSNVPVAIAMAFAAGVPAAVARRRHLQPKKCTRSED